MTIGASRSGELPLPPAAPFRSHSVATPPSLPVLDLARHAGVDAPRLLERYRRLAVASDATAAGSAAFLTLVVRFALEPPRVYVGVSMAVPAAWIALVALQRGYEGRFLGTGPEEYRRTTIAAMALFIVIAVTSFGLQQDVSRTYVLVVVPGLLLFSLAGRHLLRLWIYRIREAGQGLQRVLVLVVGRADAAVAVIEKFRQEPHHGLLAVA